MQREFQPYANLWITADKWFKYQKSWLHDEWEQLDAVTAEKFVEDAVRTLAGAIRFYKERQMDSMMKIASVVKQQIDEFKPKVPLMVALRKQGMVDRHWKQITDKVGFEVKPY